MNARNDDDDMDLEEEIPWVIMRIGDRLFGIHSSLVIEMVALKHVTELPGSPDYLRGMMKLRNDLIRIYDLRKLLKMPSVRQETENLVQLLKDREEDHKKWLSELEASVRENRPFKLALDPHKCKFGQWYDRYAAPNIVLRTHMKKFDAPHKAIHALGAEVVDLVEKKRNQEALERIEEAHNTVLDELVRIFEAARRLLFESMVEIAVVMQQGEKKIGFSVDSIESVEYLPEECIQEMPEVSGTAEKGLLNKTARSAKDDKMILLIDARNLFVWDDLP